MRVESNTEGGSVGEEGEETKREYDEAVDTSANGVRNRNDDGTRWK